MTTTQDVAQENDCLRSKSDWSKNWRREKVWEYRSMGYAIDEIVDILKNKPEVRISHGTVVNDIKHKQLEIKRNFRKYIDQELPLEHNLAITGLNRVLKEAWQIYLNGKDQKTQLTALNIISDIIMQKQAVLADPAQIQRAINTVARLAAHRLNDEDNHNAENSHTNSQQES